MGPAQASGDLSTEMEVDAFRRLFPLRFYERHLVESIRPDARPLGRARDTTLALGAVSSADGSALAKIGCTTMLAGIKMEVMTPSKESPDEGCIAIDFHMPPICSPTVRPGRPAEVAPVLSKQLSDTISRHDNVFSGSMNMVLDSSCGRLNGRGRGVTVAACCRPISGAAIVFFLLWLRNDFSL